MILIKSENMAQDLFYSGDEKILFWNAGYVAADSTLDVEKIIESLREMRDMFIADIAKQMLKNRVVKTMVVEHSRRYKYCRVFWCEDVEPEDVPEEAFHITGENGWTMRKWLED